MIDKVVLQNEFVRLEPIDSNHADGIWRAGQFKEIWQYMPVMIDAREKVAGLIGFAEQMHTAGQSLAFATINAATDELVGSTGYWNFDEANRRIEIGYTWITPKFQRTAINTACKLLMLQHAFESMNNNRVEFKTDALNKRSQAAIERIGAKREGTLRGHMVMPSGRIRDSVYFSILKDEWPEIKSRLEQKLSAE